MTYGYEEHNQPENKGKRPPRERSEYSAIFWRNVEEQLYRRRMKWDQLADIMGVSRSNISSMKSRESRLTLDTVMKVADALKVPVESLIKEGAEGPERTYYGADLRNDEYQLLSEYQKLRNRNPHSAGTALNIIMNTLKEFNRKPDEEN